MKKLMLTAAVLALAFTGCKKAEDKAVDGATTDTTSTTTVETETTEAEKPVDSATMMKAWEAYATPGDVHKVLASDTGKWKCEMTFWQPDGKSDKATSTADVKMVLGGKYQEGWYSGTMMGMPFEGKSIMGYNNAKGKVFSVWIDNMGTGVMNGEGDYDSASKTFKVSGTFTDPVSKKDKKFREEYKIVDDNTRRMSMFDEAPGGGEYKSMEIVMTRTK